MSFIENRKSIFPTKKRLLFTVTAATLGFFLCFALLEGFVRLTRPKVSLYGLTGRLPGRSPMEGWALVDAFCAYRGKPGHYAGEKTINSLGFNSTPEIARQKPVGTQRFVFLGGSSTAGTGWSLKDEDTWPWITMEILEDEYPAERFDFINGALGGYTSFESYGRLCSRLRHFSPDVVVLNHGWNEIYYFKKVDNIHNWRTLPDGSWGFQTVEKPVAMYAPKSIDPYIRWSQLLSVFRLSISTPTEGEVAPGVSKTLKNDFNRKGLDIWRTQLKLFRETCRTLGIKLFVVKQPTLITKDMGPEDRQRCRYEFHGFDHDTHLNIFAEIYRVIDEEISRDAIIDLTPLSGRSDLFFDHVHPTPKGTRVIAEKVAKALSSFVEKPMAKAPGTSF